MADVGKQIYAHLNSFVGKLAVNQCHLQKNRISGTGSVCKSEMTYAIFFAYAIVSACGVRKSVQDDSGTLAFFNNPNQTGPHWCKIWKHLHTEEDA